MVERNRPRGSSAGRAVLFAAVAGLILFPVFELVRAAVTGPVRGAGRGVGIALWNTAWTAAAAALLAAAIGTAGAWLTERRDAGALLRLGMVVPILIPPFVTAVAWTRAFGPGGLTDDVAGLTLPGLYGPAGIVLVTAVHVAPLVYVVVAAALRTRARPELEWAARAAGATGGTALRRVTLPLLAPALGGGAVLAFVASVNSFAIPAVLGIPAGFPTVTTRIFEDLVRSADPVAFGRVLLLAVTMLAGVIFVIGVGDATGVRSRPAPAGSREPAVVTRPARVSRYAAWTYVATTSGLPLVALLATGLTRAVGLPVHPGNWTLANFAGALEGGFWPAAGRSLLLAAVAATVATGLGLGLAAVSHRGRSRGLATAAAITYAVPGSALAVAVLLAYGSVLGDTVWLILVAYVAKFWALAHRAAAGSVGSIDADVVRAARAAGAAPPTVAGRILLPLLRPALGAAWLLVFLFGLHELTMSSLLYGPGSETLAVLTLNIQQLGDTTITAALAVLLTIPGVAAAVLILRRPEWRPA